jgi:hypothetical protein
LLSSLLLLLPLHITFCARPGTLTRNIMNFKCLQLEPPHFYTNKTLGKLRSILQASYVRERERNGGWSASAATGAGVDLARDGGVAVLVAPSAAVSSSSSSVSLRPVLLDAHASPFDRALSDETGQAAPPSPSQQHSARSQRHSGLPALSLHDVALDGSDAGHGSASATAAAAAAGSSVAIAAATPGHPTSRLQRQATRLLLEQEFFVVGRSKSNHRPGNEMIMK